jgi:hypothetical protein
LQVHELSQPSPLKESRPEIRTKDSLRDEKQITHQKWQKAITLEKIEVDNESMKRLYIDEFDKIREEKVIKFSQN